MVLAEYVGEFLIHLDLKQVLVFGGKTAGRHISLDLTDAGTRQWAKKAG